MIRPVPKHQGVRIRKLSVGIVETDTQLAEAYAVRAKVFVEEQGVSMGCGPRRWARRCPGQSS